MSIKYVFWGLVIVTTLVFSTVFAASSEIILALVTIGVGALWIAADVRIETSLETVFFLIFLGLAVAACSNEALILLTLLGISADLAAWDLARFCARLDGQTEQDMRILLESQHLRVLAVTISAGFVIAALPTFIQLSAPFIIVCTVAVLTLLMLQQAVNALRTPDRQ